MKGQNLIRVLECLSGNDSKKNYYYHILKK